MGSVLSANFSLSEFGGIYPDELLLQCLQIIRQHSGKVINITSAGRDIADHVSVYKDIANKTGQNWWEIITWQSRHLPKHGETCLLAVDMTMGTPSNLSTGDEIYQALCDGLSEIFHDAQEEILSFLGVGIGKYYMHLDVDRTQHTIWKYGY